MPGIKWLYEQIKGEGKPIHVLLMEAIAANNTQMIQAIAAAEKQGFVLDNRSQMQVNQYVSPTKESTKYLYENPSSSQ